ncbi:bacitracin resistance undecaprenyl-diphosphatase BcrD, partial [Enterococcus faecalis]
MALDFIEILKVIFLGIVEGITEWLPISSTGHMLLVDEFITLNMSEAFKEMFFVVIQLGAILAVVVMFWNKMFPFQFKNKSQSIIKKDTFSLWFKVAVACVPSAIMGILFDDYLDAHLHTPVVIAIMLILYGVLFIVIENRNKKRTATTSTLADISYKTALMIGVFQVLSLIPGTSRSGATIIGA